MLAVLVGLGAGVIASLAAWWIVARALAPRVWLSDHVSRGAGGEDMAQHYNVKIVNAPRRFRRRPAVDVEVTALYGVRGLEKPDGTRARNAITIPILVGHTGRVRYLEEVSILRLRLDKVDAPDLALMPKERAAIADGTVELEALLGLGTDAWVRLVVSASDSYSGSRRTWVKKYRTEDVIPGRFARGASRAGLRVVRGEVGGPGNSS